MQIIEKNVEELIPYINNPRNNECAIDAVASSIAEFGFKVPCVIDKNNVLVTGHTRLLGAKKLGLKTVPCIIADDLSDAQIKAFRLADNKVSEFATWNEDLLKAELEQLKDLDFEMSDFGFELSELNSLDDVVEDDVPEIDEEKEPTTKQGQIYKLGNHRLMCGDSTSIDDVKKLCNGEQIDLLVTDPPYNVAFNGRSGKFDVILNDKLTENDFNNFINSFANVVNQLNIKNYYIWCNWKFYGILQALFDFKSCIVWGKNNFGLGRGYRHQHEFCLFNGEIDNDVTSESDLWLVNKDTNYVHPTQKPVQLFARTLNNHKQSKNILDLFGGSGTTMIACEQLGRNAFLMELDPRYCDVIIQRWEQLTGKKAELIQ